MVKILVLRVEGTNCDQETVNALEVVGATPELVHINELIKGLKNLEEYQGMIIPGGFSHGDDISAGIILANQMKYLLGRDLQRFVEEGKPIIGICNGFQALVKSWLLPAINGPFVKQDATLAFNDTGIFKDTWVHLKPTKNHKCKFLQRIKNEVYLPIAHAEGRFVTDKETLEELKSNKQIVFKYVENPNGSVADIAGVCNPEGNVFGMMPHPERYMHKWMHPHWTRGKLAEEGDGLLFFQGFVEYASKF